MENDVRGNRLMNIEYNSLIITDAEKEKLIKNRDEIVSWIHSNIIEYILPKDCISIDYGEDYRCPRTGELTTSYHLDVCGGQSVLSSHNGKHILLAHKFGNFEPLNDIEDYEDIYSLIDNWPEIKNSLQCAIASRADVHNKINNFNV